MILTEEQPHKIENHDRDLANISIADLTITLWARRRWLTKAIGIGTLLSLGLTLLAFLSPNEYSSTAQLMPPDPDMFSTVSAISLLSASNFPNLGGGLFDNRTAGATVIGVLGSPAVQDDLVNRFDLRRIYGRKLLVDARKSLAGNTVFVEDKKSGIVSITVRDKDRYLARDLAQAYVDELDKLANTLSTSSARRERLFLEDRLKAVKTDLDANSRALSQFSSQNAAFDPAKQGEATIEAAGRLQGELITAEGQVSALKAMYTDDNIRVREARARVEALQGQLQKIGGKSGTGNASDSKADELFPSVRQLPLLGYTYYNLYLQVTIDQNVYETLTKEYELAKVQEAKELPVIKVLDAPAIAERKSGPHRSLILIAGFVLSVFLSIIGTIIGRLWETLDDSSDLKQIVATIMQSRRKQNEILQPDKLAPQHGHAGMHQG